MFIRCFWILALFTVAGVLDLSAGEDAPLTSTLTKDQLVAKLASYNAQLKTRDETITILERQLGASKKNIALKDAIIETRDTENANLKQIQANQTSLAKFQDSQIEQLRQVIRNQREQLNELNKE